MMEIDALPNTSPEACQRHQVDSVMGTPALGDDAIAQPGSEAGSESQSGDRTEHVQPADDHATKTVTIQALYANYAASFPAPAQLRKLVLVKHSHPTQRSEICFPHTY